MAVLVAERMQGQTEAEVRTEGVATQYQFKSGDEGWLTRATVDRPGLTGHTGVLGTQVMVSGFVYRKSRGIDMPIFRGLITHDNTLFWSGSVPVESGDIFWTTTTGLGEYVDDDGDYQEVDFVVEDQPGPAESLYQNGSEWLHCKEIGTASLTSDTRQEVEIELDPYAIQIIDSIYMLNADSVTRDLLAYLGSASDKEEQKLFFIDEVASGGCLMLPNSNDQTGYISGDIRTSGSLYFLTLAWKKGGASDGGTAEYAIRYRYKRSKEYYPVIP